MQNKKNVSKDVDDIIQASELACDYLKLLANPVRLRLLCHLLPGEKSVQELEELLGSSQTNVSHQLGRLKENNLILGRREGKNIFYSIVDERAKKIIFCLKQWFC